MTQGVIRRGPAKSCPKFLPPRGSLRPSPSPSSRHPLKQSSAFSSPLFPPHCGPPLFFSARLLSAPLPHPTPIQHLPCSLGARPVNHRRRQPQPGPHLLPGSWRASGSCLGPPSALRGARRSVSGAGRGEPPGPPGLGLPVTDSVSMANNLTPTIVWRGQAPGQITRPIRARAAAPHARLE